MRRRTQIVLAITFMVAALVSGASYIYISQILRQRIATAYDTAVNLNSNLAYLATSAAPDLSSTRVDTSNPEALRRGIAYYLGTDRDLNTMLESVVGSWPTIYDAAILDADGKALLDTDPNLVEKKSKTGRISQFCRVQAFVESCGSSITPLPCMTFTFHCC